MLWVKHQYDVVLIWRAKLATSAAPFGRLMEGHLATIKAASSLCDRRLLIVLSAAAPARRRFAFVLLVFLLVVLYDPPLAVDDAFTMLDLSRPAPIYILYSASG